VNSITIAKLKLLVLNPRKQLHGLAYKGAFGSLDDACFACLDKEDQGIGCLARYLGFCTSTIFLASLGQAGIVHWCWHA